VGRGTPAKPTICPMPWLPPVSQPSLRIAS